MEAANEADLINIVENADWQNDDYKRIVMAHLVNAVYLIAENKEEEATRWYETFHFKRHRDLLNSANDINGVVFKFDESKAQQYHRSLEKSPLFVVALRGTGNKWDDVLLTGERVYCNLRVWKTIISIKNLFIQNPKEREDRIWLIGDSLGATIATYSCLSLAEENKIYLNTFLFNPPFTNSNLFDRVPNDALKKFDNDRFKPSTLFGRAIRRFLVWLFVGDMTEVSHSKEFNNIDGWIPYLYVNVNDPICKGFIEHFEEGNNLDNIIPSFHSRRKNNDLDDLHKIPSVVDCYSSNLLPSGHLVKNTRNNQITSAHDLNQWLHPNFELVREDYINSDMRFNPSHLNSHTKNWNDDNYIRIAMSCLLNAVYLISKNQNEEARAWYDYFNFEHQEDILNSSNEIIGVVFKFNDRIEQNQATLSAPSFVIALRGMQKANTNDVRRVEEISRKFYFKIDREPRIFLTGHSSGVLFAAYMSKFFRYSSKTFLFNPPFTARMISILKVPSSYWDNPIHLFINQDDFMYFEQYFIEETETTSSTKVRLGVLKQNPVVCSGEKSHAISFWWKREVDTQGDIKYFKLANEKEVSSRERNKVHRWLSLFLENVDWDNTFKKVGEQQTTGSPVTKMELVKKDWIPLYKQNWDDDDYRRIAMSSLVNAVYLISAKKDEDACAWYETFDFKHHRNILNSSNDIIGVIFELNFPMKQTQSPWLAPQFVVALRGMISEGESKPVVGRSYIEDDVIRVIGEVEKLKQRDKADIWFTGHSFGALVMAYIYSSSTQQQFNSETFLFNPPFTEWFGNILKSKNNYWLYSPMSLFVNPDDSLCNSFIGYFDQHFYEEIETTSTEVKSSLALGVLKQNDSYVGNETNPHALSPWLELDTYQVDMKYFDTHQLGNNSTVLENVLKKVDWDDMGNWFESKCLECGLAYSEKEKVLEKNKGKEKLMLQ